MFNSAWCIMASPLVFGTALTPAVLSILSNADAIAIDQDPMGVQGVRVHVSGDPIYTLDEYKNGLVHWPQEVWAKPLATGERAVLVVNHNDSAAATVNISLLDIARVYPPLLAGPVTVYDLWTHSIVANITGLSWQVTVAPLDCFFFLLTGLAMV
jgi:alpha-galactosidase